MSFAFLPQECEQECEPEIAELVGRPDGQQQTQVMEHAGPGYGTVGPHTVTAVLL